MVRLTIDRHGMLQELEVSFEVLQEYAPSSSSIAAVAVTAAVGGGKGDVNTLGFVRLNLAEYVEVGNSNTGEGEEGEVVRRYLMQGSKINSTLKVCTTVSYPALPCLLSFYSLFRMHHGDTNPHISDWNPHDPNRRRNKLHRVLNPTPLPPTFC